MSLGITYYLEMKNFNEKKKEPIEQIKSDFIQLEEKIKLIEDDLKSLLCKLPESFSYVFTINFSHKEFNNL